MNKSSLKNLLLTIFGLTLMVSSCSDLGCFDPGDDGTEIKSLKTFLIPLNENSVSNVEGNFQPLTDKKEEDFYYTWKSLQYNKDNQNSEKDDGGPKEDFYVYAGKRVSVGIEGSVMLAGFRITEEIPLEIQQITYKENGADKIIYTSPMRLLPLYVNPGEKIMATYTEKGPIPKLGGVELRNGLGIFIALIESDSATVGRYGDYRKWTCSDGLALSNRCEGNGDNITNCSDHSDYGSCNPTTDSWCSGFHSRNETELKAYADQGSNRSLVDSLPMRKRLANLGFYLYGSPNAIFKRSFGDVEYKGINVSSGTADKDSRHNRHGPPTHTAATCGALFTTPWTQLRDFSICTHNFTIQGWSANQTPVDDPAPQLALMSGVGPISRWYFTDPSTTCEELDTKYGIKSIAGFFGGTYNYVASGSRVYWSGPYDTPRLECDAKDGGNYYCNEVSSFTRRVQPKICPNNQNISLRWPLQIVLVRSGLADNTPLNRGNYAGFANCVKNKIAECKQNNPSALGESICNSWANQQCNGDLSSAPCATKMTHKNTGITYTVNTGGGQKDWLPFSVLLQEGDTISLLSEGSFDHSHHHTMSKGAFSDWTWNLFPAEMYSDVAGRRPCSAVTMYAVQPLTFVSCFSRFQNACSNQRVPTSFCVESREKVVNTPGAGQTDPDAEGQAQAAGKIFIGSCLKRLKQAGQDVPQAYQYPDYKRVNTLTDVNSSIFSEAENVEDQHCGICAKKNLPFDNNTGLPLVSSADLSDSSTTSTITTRSQCENSSDYQWLSQYYDKDAGDSVSLVFTPNRKSSTCGDSESSQIVRGKINSLTNIAYKRTTGNTNSIIFGGIFSNLGLSGSASIEVPKNNKRYFIIAGYAGNGNNPETLFSEGDAQDNLLVKEGETMKKSDFIEKVTGQKPDLSPEEDTDTTSEKDVFRASQLSLISGTYLKNGESVYVYIQEFKKNPDGSYTSEPDPEKHPAKVFGEKTHPNDIIKKMARDSSIPIREYTTSYDMLDGSKDGLALWRVSLSGKLWFAILDYKPGSIDGRTDGKYVTFSAEKDGDINPKVQSGLSNVLYWNTGRYSVMAKTESNKGSLSTGGWISDKINVILVEFVKQIFFGRKITNEANCKTILKPKPPDDTPTDENVVPPGVDLGDVEKPIKPVENACKEGFADGDQDMAFNVKEQFCQNCARLAFSDPVRNAYIKLTQNYLGPTDATGSRPCNTVTINGAVSNIQFSCNPEAVDACAYNGYKTTSIVNAGNANDMITICPKPTPPLTGGTILYECKNASRAYKQSLVDEALPNEPLRIADESSVEIKQCITTYTMGCYQPKVGGGCWEDHDIDGELLYRNTGGGFESGTSADFGGLAEREIAPASSYDRIIRISGAINIRPQRGLGSNTAWCHILLDTAGTQNYGGAEGKTCAERCYPPEQRGRQLGFKDTTEIFYTTGTSNAPRDQTADNTALTVSADAYLLERGKPVVITYRAPSKTSPYDFCYQERSKYTWAMAFINTNVDEIIFAQSTTEACPAGIGTKTPTSSITKLSDLDVQIKNMARQNGCSQTAVKDCQLLLKIDESSNNSQLVYDPAQGQRAQRVRIFGNDSVRCLNTTANQAWYEKWCEKPVVEVKKLEFAHRPQFKDRFNWCHLKNLSGGFVATKADLEECGSRCYGNKDALTKAAAVHFARTTNGVGDCQDGETGCRRLTGPSPSEWSYNWSTNSDITHPQYVVVARDSFFLELITPDHSLPTCPDAVPGATYKMPVRAILHLHNIAEPNETCQQIPCSLQDCPTFQETGETVIFDKCESGSCSDPLLDMLYNSTNQRVTRFAKYMCIGDIPAGATPPPLDPNIVTEIDIPAQPSTCNPLVKNPDGSTTVINSILGLKARKYGDCAVGCQDGSANCLEYQKVKVCNVYEMYKNNNPEIDIFECMRAPFSDTTCWRKRDLAQCDSALPGSTTQCSPLYATQELAYPYDIMQDDDFTTDSVSPSCSEYENKPFKTFQNCRHETETFDSESGKKEIMVQKCDIIRDCGGQRTQKDAKLKADINYSGGGSDSFTNGNNGTSFTVKSCEPQYTHSKAGGRCSDIKNISSIQDLMNLPDYNPFTTTQAQLQQTLQNLRNSWCIRTTTYDCKTCKRPMIKGSDGSFKNLTQTAITAGVIPNQYGCQTPDNRMFFCNSTELSNVCGNSSGLGSSNISIPTTGENVTVCNIGVKILETVQEASEAEARQVDKSFSFTGEDCKVQFKCFSEDDIRKSQEETPPDLSNAGMGIQDGNKYETIKVCSSTRAWEEGFVYLLFKTFTGNFNLQVIIYLIVILMLTMKGYGVLLGNTKIDQTSMVKDAINLSIVLGFFSSTGWDLYEKYVLTAILNFMDDVNSLVTRALNPEDIEGRNPFGPIDDVFNSIFLSKTTWYRVLAILFGRLTGFIFIIAILFSFFSFLMIFTRSVIQYLSSLIILSMYLSLGPIFILFKLHPRTANYFTNWWQGIMGFLVAQFYLFSIIALFTMLYLNIVEALLYFKVCYRSIITIPVVNISILGWFVLADEVPANLKIYFDTFDTTGTSQGGGYPSLTELATLLIIVATMEKFVTTPLFGGKAGRDSFFKELDGKVKAFREKGRQVATSAATKPFRAAGSFASKKVGQGAGLAKKGAAKAGSKAMGAIRGKSADKK